MLDSVLLEDPSGLDGAGCSWAFGPAKQLESEEQGDETGCTEFKRLSMPDIGFSVV